MRHILHKVTAIMAFTMVTLTAMAQTWVAPTKPERPTFPDIAYPALEGADPEVGNAYYIRSVGSGQFLTAANNWATQISVSEDMNPYMQIMIEDAGDETYPDGIKMRLNGTFYFTGPTPSGAMRENYAVTDKYLFRETEETGQVDRRSQACWYWQFVKVGDVYRIMSYPGMNNFNKDANQFMYDQGAGKPALMNGTEETQGIDWIFIPVDNVDVEAFKELADEYNETFQPLKEQYDIDFAAYQAALPVYRARLLLYELLCDATLCGADTTEPGAIYNNEESTLDELNAAAEELRAKVREQMLVYAFKNSTADNPIDLTKYLLQNPDFNTGNTNGWDITAGMGQNLGYQANNIYINKEKDIEVSQFIEAWTPAPGYLNDGTISQTIFGLPSGHYRLSCDAMAQHQTGEEDEDNYVYPEDYTGIYLYYSDGEIVVLSDFIIKAAQTEDEMGNINRVPQHFEFEFDIDQVDSVSVGLIIQNTNMNWVLADNFRLQAAGPSQTPPSFTALRGEYTISKKLLDSDYESVQKSVEDALIKAANDALSLLEDGADPAKADAYTTAFTTLKNARIEMQASIAAYNRLANFLETLYADLEKYKAQNYCEPVAETIEELAERMEDGYDFGTLSITEIDETINSYNTIIAEQVGAILKELASKGEELKEPFDITILFPHMSYEYGTTQTSFAGGYPANDPVWMNPGGISQFKTNYSTAEVWDVFPFEIYREFENLPMGKYSIETNAFVRVGENQENYDNWKAGFFNEGGYAYIYAGNSKSEMVNVAELAVPETATGYAAITVEDGTQMYVPNSQQSFYNLLNDPNAVERAEKTRVSATGIVAKDGGTLRVGVVGTDMLLPKHWVIWSGFRLFYYGSNDEVLFASLNEEIKELISQTEVEMNKTNIEEVTTTLTEAIKTGNDALSINVVETKSAAIEQLKQALALAAEEHSLMEELINLSSSYSGQELTSVYTDNVYPALMEEIDECIINEGYGTKTLQQVRDYIDALPKAFFRYLLSDVQLDSATQDNAVDMTGLLVNPDFATATTANRTAPKGWTLELELPTQGNVESNNGGYEIWNTGGARFYQELPCLRDGYWRLTVDGLFRTGTPDETLKRYNAGELDVYGYLFANDASTKLYSWFAEGQYTTEDMGLGGMQRITAEKDTLYAPNSGASVQNYFNSGRYTDNSLTFHYTEGPVQLGVFKSPETTIAQDWIYVDNFRLFYLGLETPDAVDSVNHVTNTPSAIYGLDGRRQSRVQRGVNIIRMSDGTIRKVLVK